MKFSRYSLVAPIAAACLFACVPASIAQQRAGDRQRSDDKGPEQSIEKMLESLGAEGALSDILERMMKDGGAGMSLEEFEKMFGEELGKNLQENGGRMFKLEGEVDPEALGGFAKLLEGLAGNRKADEYEKEAEGILDDYKPVVARATQSTVRILADGRQKSLGTIVSEDGYVLTKLSELPKGTIGCELAGGLTIEAELKDQYPTFDLALIKLDADGLQPANWASQTVDALGTLVAIGRAHV